LATPLIRHQDTHWEFQDETKPALKYIDLKWEQLSSFCKSTLVKSFSIWFVLVPFLVKLLDKTPEKISFTLFEKVLTLALQSPLPMP
jgi:hypothetical protein